MDRKKFCKTTCGLGIGSCVGFGLLSNGSVSAAEKPIQEAAKSTPVVPTDPRQIRNVLRFVDSSMEEPVKKQIFERLGLEHTTNDRYTGWINGYKKDIKSFFDMVNANKDTVPQYLWTANYHWKRSDRNRIDRQSIGSIPLWYTDV